MRRFVVVRALISQKYLVEIEPEEDESHAEVVVAEEVEDYYEISTVEVIEGSIDDTRAHHFDKDKRFLLQ